jgi:hypothetical protein
MLPSPSTSTFAFENVKYRMWLHADTDSAAHWLRAQLWSNWLRESLRSAPGPSRVSKGISGRPSSIYPRALSIATDNESTMALFPEVILTNWITPLNIAGLLTAYISWNVSTLANWFCVTLALSNDALLLASLAHLCFLLVASQKCSWTSSREDQWRILALRGYGWASSKND